MNTNTAPRRAALYVRQSKEDRNGIERQLPRVTGLANLRGWTIVDVYQDDDVTASKSRAVGTDWARMLADAAAGECQGL